MACALRIILLTPVAAGHLLPHPFSGHAGRCTCPVVARLPSTCKLCFLFFFSIYINMLVLFYSCCSVHLAVWGALTSQQLRRGHISRSRYEINRCLRQTTIKVSWGGVRVATGVFRRGPHYSVFNVGGDLGWPCFVWRRRMWYERLWAGKWCCNSE
jgi:hypothetical protein